MFLCCSELVSVYYWQVTCKTMATSSASIKEQKQVSSLGSRHTDPQLVTSLL